MKNSNLLEIGKHRTALGEELVNMLSSKFPSFFKNIPDYDCVEYRMRGINFKCPSDIEEEDLVMEIAHCIEVTRLAQGRRKRRAK